jgi:Spy/CpxP family protein refolding chaperone
MKRPAALVLTGVLALAASPALAQNDGHMMGDHGQGMMDDGDHGQGMMGNDGHGMTDHHDQ